MIPRAALVRLFALAALLFTLVTSCGPSPDITPASPQAAQQAKPKPTSIPEVAALKKGGVSWTNEEIRVYYNEVVSTIAASDEQWKREGIPLPERARRAFTIRHDARALARAMMTRKDEMEALERRDQEKYGHPDGPTFEGLVEAAKQKGTVGDAIYEGIISSSQRTDQKTNEAFGVKRP